MFFEALPDPYVLIGELCEVNLCTEGFYIMKYCISCFFCVTKNMWNR